MVDRQPVEQRRPAAALPLADALLSDAAFPELTRLTRTVDALREAGLAHFDIGEFSNGPPEATNY
jgi:hypothetical protein